MGVFGVSSHNAGDSAVRQWLQNSTSKERAMSLYAGLDTSVNTTAICVVDRNGAPDVIAEQL
jgi:hypothetical protein